MQDAQLAQPNWQQCARIVLWELALLETRMDILIQLAQAEIARAEGLPVEQVRRETFQVLDKAADERFSGMIRSAGIPDFPDGFRPSLNGGR
jgi:hypothetical protein